MAAIQITGDWDKIKMKIKRKYRDLTDADLQFTKGMEDDLIERISKAISQDRKYVEFMLKKMMVNSETNRL